MLKKMRRRFIASAMAAFTIVVVVLLCCINLWNYHNTTRRLDGTLDFLLKTGGQDLAFALGQEPPPPDGARPFSGEFPYMTRFFSVTYGADGRVQNIDQDYIASVSQSEALQYAGRVLASGRTFGFYNGYRYLVSGGSEGRTVIFLNAEQDLQALRELLLTTLLTAAVCLLVVFLLVLLLAKRAIQPYLRNLEMQKQFITNAGHELKTPLTAISTSADVLAMENGSSEWVQNIQQQSGKLAKLISRLVALSRLNEENPFPEKSLFSLSDALWETADSFAALLQAKGKTYGQAIEDGLTLWGDRAAIQQMMSILFDNAAKYSPPGGVVSLRAYRSGKKTVIELSNTCQNLPDEALPHLFDRFYRADSSHSGAVAGSGIGLSIAKATAEAHNGSICAKKQGGALLFQIVL